MAEPNDVDVSNKVKSYQSNGTVPKTLVPELLEPETEVPETSVPEINQVESITNVPVTNVPVTNVPVTNVPQRNISVTNALNDVDPVTNVQQTNVLNKTNTFNNSPKEEDIEGENQEPNRSPIELPDEIPPSFKNNTNGVSSTGVSSTGVSQAQGVSSTGVSHAQGETVLMEKEVDDVTPIITRVMRHKGHHFTLRKNDMTALTELIEGMGYTVEFPTEMTAPDVIVSKEGDVACKVHFLLCDKKDADKIDGKRYIHLYFFASFDPIVKDAIVGFFKEMSTAPVKRSRRSSSHRKSPSHRKSSSHRKSPSHRKSSSHRKSPSYKKTSSNKYLLGALSRITSHKSKKKWHTKRRVHRSKRHYRGKTHRGKTHRGKTKRHHTKRRKHTTRYRRRQ